VQSQKDDNLRFQVQTDTFGYRWVIVENEQFEELVAALHMVSITLTEEGFGAQLLAAIFRFDTASRPIYWIYNYKRGSFYPFVPAAGDQQRDNERELVLKAQVGSELPIEPELERWFPLWGIPI
jgi:hypothetical protein